MKKRGDERKSGRSRGKAGHQFSLSFCFCEKKYTDLAAGMSACMKFGEAGKLLVPATDFLMPAN